MACDNIGFALGRKGKTVRSEGRQIVSNVVRFFDKEAREKEHTFPLEQATKRAASACGFSEYTIKKIRKESSDVVAGTSSNFVSPGKHRKRPSDRNVEVDDFDKCVIRRTIHDFYIRENIVPTVRKLLPVLREKINFKWGRSSLLRVVKEMGFRFKKCQNNRNILIERADIVLWRTKYLRAMKRLRETYGQDNIVYVDETWVDSNLTFGKCWQDGTTAGAKAHVNSSNRLIVVHAGSSAGFIKGAGLIYKAGTSSGDYHGQMNAVNFVKLLEEKLLPNLPQKSVIVIDNAPYHNKH